MYARRMAASGRNRLPFRYRDRKIVYRYLDGPSLLYLTNCLEGGLVAHEQIPITLFDLPEHYDIAIDVGAHFGVYSVLLGVLNDVELFCFEPNPQNRRVLEANLAENGIDAVVDPRVVSDRTGSVTFYHRRGFNTVSHSTEPPLELRGEFERSEVESVALSSLLSEREGANVFVKIDAEGEEDRIVRDLLGVDGIGEVSGLLELHLDKLADDGESTLAALEERGFVYELVKRSENQPGYRFTNAPALGRTSPFGRMRVT